MRSRKKEKRLTKNGFRCAPMIRSCGGKSAKQVQCIDKAGQRLVKVKEREQNPSRYQMHTALPAQVLPESNRERQDKTRSGKRLLDAPQGTQCQDISDVFVAPLTYIALLGRHGICFWHINATIILYRRHQCRQTPHDWAPGTATAKKTNKRHKGAAQLRVLPHVSVSTSQTWWEAKEQRRAVAF